jgi:hypothetical protein
VGPIWPGLRVCFGERTIGHLVLPMPAAGRTGGEVGVAAWFSGDARRPYDGRQPRSRNRGSTRSE